MSRVLLVLLAVGLAVYALVDLASSDDERRGGVPKGLWVVLVILLPFLGPIAWILVSRAATRGAGGSGVGRPSGSGPARRRGAPLAPDDDPDFLWRLDQQQRRQAREPGPTDGPVDGPADGPVDAPQDGPTSGPDTGRTDDGPDDNGTTGNNTDRDGSGTR